ncbi:hypothetical protein VCRA2119O147_370002 [Vibrio crassostreae]|uniref:Uncharacterized protein n=2 Tax=Vibrio crassostreae TaxID=246167 RepID=A0A822MV29_9VIBR|nr:hypothetical protein VCRA2110O180_100043 [Vibrio crassostreae]CAK1696149.1 hypothetical protein VCRA2110O181_100043 [Vibrio crassostreae]CAK1696241.1 hypothetical protein VCRA2113O198_100043 [Vibrio crassostreae]CAK1696298.1 hypothetical protein VCRA2113O220_100043 [Vibrio crassostreae]CAK1701507.1 hypothetical protein VCRA2110O177_100102 [Vibrio crassostreae]
MAFCLPNSNCSLLTSAETGNMTSVITKVESAVMGLNLRLFKLIIDSLDYEVSKPFLERNVCKLVDFKNDGYQLKGAQNCLRSIKGYAATGILATCRLIFIVNFIGHYVFTRGIGLLLVLKTRRFLRHKC